MPRTVPVTSQQVPGSYVTSALWNAGPKALGDFTLAQPLFVGYQAAAQSIPNGVWTAAALDTTTVDSDGGHSNVTNNSRYTCQVPGVYLFLGIGGFVSNATGVRGAWFQKNATAINGSQTNLSTVTGSAWSAGCWAAVRLAAADYVELAIFQNSGAALNTIGGPTATCYVAAYWLSN